LQAKTRWNTWNTTEAIVTRSDDERRAELFGPDPRTALEALLVDEFRAALLMTEDDEDELPVDQSFFDLGLTSLRLMEIKQRVESILRVEISATALFNFPTVTRLVDYLLDEVLPGLAEAPENLLSAAPTRI
jgi:acyl carrier protein